MRRPGASIPCHPRRRHHHQSPWQFGVSGICPYSVSACVSAFVSAAESLLTPLLRRLPLLLGHPPGRFECRRIKGRARPSTLPLPAIHLGGPVPSLFSVLQSTRKRTRVRCPLDYSPLAIGYWPFTIGQSPFAHAHTRTRAHAPLPPGADQGTMRCSSRRRQSSTQTAPRRQA